MSVISDCIIKNTQISGEDVILNLIDKIGYTNYDKLPEYCNFKYARVFKNYLEHDVLRSLRWVILYLEIISVEELVNIMSITKRYINRNKRLQKQGIDKLMLFNKEFINEINKDILLDILEEFINFNGLYYYIFLKICINI